MSPLISYLIPTLDRLVAPYQLLTRQEVPREGMSPRSHQRHQGSVLYLLAAQPREKQKCQRERTRKLF